MFTREQQQNHEHKLNSNDAVCRDDESDSVNHGRVREAMACKDYLDRLNEPESALCIAKLYDSWSSEQAAFANGIMWFGEYEIVNVDGLWVFENLYKMINTAVYPTVIEGLKTTERLVQQGVA